MSSWSIAIAIGLSFTRPSDLTIDQPASQNHAVFHNVRWAGQSFVSPLYYVVRFGKGDVQVDFTHYKVIAEVHEEIPVTGTWHGDTIDETAPMSNRVQHFEISHGVNALGIIGLAHAPNKRGVYIGGGPVIFLPHAENTVDGTVSEWGYAYGGAGVTAMVGDGIPAPWAELKYAGGNVKVGIANGGTASTSLSTFELSVAP